jgi:hypothetical protein
MIQNTFWRRVLIFALLVVAYYGFSFVTQSGQTGVVIQNDGYAGTGGFMLIASGFLLGLLVERPKDGKKTKRR